MNNCHLPMDKYPLYKDSGVAWLGEIPKHWSVKRVKDEFNSLDYKRVPLSGEIRGLMTKQVYDYYGASGVIDKVEDYIFAEPTLLIGEDGANLLMRNSPLAFIARGKYWVNNHAHILKPKKGNISFLCNLLESFDYTAMISGSAQPKFTAGQLSRVFLMIPPLDEQDKIANYLDTKTAQIDRKIELLSQKSEKYAKLKQSLINETVTRGLDKSVPMKDTGIEWIGDVPEHWEVKHLKSLAKIKGGKDSKAVEIEVEGYPIYGSGGVFGRASEYLHKKTSVLLGRKGTIDKPLFVTEPFWSVDTMFYTDIKKNIDPKFFYYQCLTIRFGLYQYGSAVPSMSENVLSRILFATPKYDEQQKISSYLNEKTMQIAQIVEVVNSQIGNLKELRKTLINDVVTGKIKVV